MALTGLDLLTLEFWDKGMCRCVWAPFLFLPSPLPRTSLFQIQSLLFHFPSKKKKKQASQGCQPNRNTELR